MQSSLIKKFLYFSFFTFALTVLYFSYQNNILMAANNNWYKNFQLDSEQLVLDGLLMGGEIPKLGRFTRPSIENQYLYGHELFENANKEGVFEDYKSQYGLQIKFFHWLKKIGFKKVNHFKSLTAFLMAFVVMGLAITIWRDFSLRSALLFYFIFLLSPWIVSFSSNLYWITFLWFTPLLLTSVFSSKIYFNIKSYYFLLILTFFAFLLKFLSGYEYITTIVLASVVPIVYHGLKLQKRIKTILMMCGGVLIISVVAFLTSVLIHAKSLDSSSISGFEVIKNTAKKRLSSKDVDKLLTEICSADSSCLEEYEIYRASLESNSLKVSATYFVDANFLPWVSSTSFDEKEKKLIKEVRDEVKIKTSVAPILNLEPSQLYKLAILFFEYASSRLAFLFLIAACLMTARATPLHLSIPLLISFIAPLSWFILAKGHSYIHTHMNYVLWYLYFIPFSAVVLVEVKWKK